MTQPAPWSVKGIDREARETAREAARRSGQTLGEWLNNVISEHAGEEAHDEDSAAPRSSDSDLVRALEAVTRLAELSADRRRASAEFEGDDRRSPDSMGRRDQDQKILEILQSVERRLGVLETQPHGQDRNGIDPAMTMMADALRTIGSRLDSLDSPGGYRESIALADRLTQRIDSVRAAMEAARTSPPRVGLGRGASPLAREIAARQRSLETGGTARATPSFPRKAAAPAASADTRALEVRLDALQRAIERMSVNDAVSRPFAAPAVNLRPLEDKLADLAERIDRMGAPAPAFEAGHIDTLTERLDALRDDFARRPSAEPPREETELARMVSGQLSDLRRMMAGLASREGLDHVWEDLRNLARRVDETEARMTSVIDQRLSAQPAASALFSDGLAEALNDIVQRLDRPAPAQAGERTAQMLESVTDRLERLAAQIERLDTNAPRGPSARAPDAPAAPPRIVLPRPRAPEPAPPPPAPEPRQEAESWPDAEPTPVMRMTRDLASERPLPPTEDDLPLEPGAAPPPRRAGKGGTAASVQAARNAAIAAAAEMARQSEGRPVRDMAALLAEEEAPSPGLLARLRGMLPGGKAKTKAMADEDAAPRKRAAALDVSLEPEDEDLKGRAHAQRRPMVIALFVLFLGVIAAQLSPVPIVPEGLRDMIFSLMPFGQKPAEKVSSLKAKPTDSASAARVAQAPAEPAKPVRQIESKPADMSADAASVTPAVDDSNGDVTASVVTATGKVVAPEGVAISPGWQYERGNTKPVANAKLPAALISAADRGVPEAAYEMGNRYLEGKGVPVSPKDAASWYERAADKGIVPAQYRLGSLYEKGNGVARDPERAKGLYIKAAQGGNAKAMHNLAVIAAEGENGKPNFKDAAGWFQKAAELGIADSQYNLGILYARGLGVDVNLAESYKWFGLAALQGDKDAGKKRDDVGARLDAQTLATAQMAVRTFVTRKEPDSAIDTASPPAAAPTATNAPAPAAAQAAPARQARNDGKR